MTLTQFASVALLAVVVPHAPATRPAPAAAPAVHAEGPTQSFERLKYLGVSSPGQAREAAQSSAAANKSGSEARQIPLGRVHPVLGRRAGFAKASVPIPTPTGQAVVAPDAGFSGFAGLTHNDQRTAGTGVYTDTQFSLEPPDQGLCVGNGFVMETVNDALAVYSTQGTRTSGPAAFNQFWRLAPEVNRTSQPRLYGPSLGDPRCHFDVDTQRWFITEYEEDTNLLTGTATGSTAVFLAVSQTADPNGAYSIFAIDATDSGSPGHAGCPCFPDQPLFGADAYGIYISTNEFPLAGNGFNGSQIYALSKRALAAGLLPTVVHINAGALPTPDAGGTWYSIQPANSPDSTQETTSHNGTEFFLSALQFGPAPTDNRIAVWSLTNTQSLQNAAPNVTLQHVVIGSTAYGQPASAVQKAGPTPLGTSLGDPLELIQTNDDRMNQVVFSGGRLWSAVNTVVRFGAGTNTGIAYFVVAPTIAASGSLGARMTSGGYVAVRNENVIFPSIGVNTRGIPVMAFTLVGPDYFPSAAYVTETAGQVSNVKLAGPGSAPDDGFTGYSQYGGTGAGRWGDYTAAVADRDGSIWFATEYIPNAPRSLLANWGTFIGHVPTH